MKKITLIQLCVAIISFTISIYILPFHTSGDQIVYSKVYQNIESKDLFQALSYYRGQIESLELVHFLYIYISSNLVIDKNIAIALINSLLGIVFTKIIFKYFKYSYTIILLVVSNYYLLALFFTLERLKFGILFLLLSIIFYRNSFFRYLFIFLSILSHLSVIIPIIIWEFFLIFRNIYINKKQFLILILNFIILILVYNFYESQINAKIEPYLFINDINNMLISVIKTSIFLVLSIYVSGKININHFLIFIPLIFLSSIIEPARINLFALMFFIYFCVKSEYIIKAKFVLLFVLIYYSLTGLIYLKMIIQTGG